MDCAARETDGAALGPPPVDPASHPLSLTLENPLNSLAWFSFQLPRRFGEAGFLSVDAALARRRRDKNRRVLQTPDWTAREFVPCAGSLSSAGLLCDRLSLAPAFVCH
jgi:hypothetical protein